MINSNLHADIARQFMAERVMRSLGIPASLVSYRCPFDFITEFDQWCEFHTRQYFGKESTYSIIRSMLTDGRNINEFVDASEAANYSSARMEVAYWKEQYAPTGQ